MTWVFRIFVTLYAIAVVLFLIGTFGWFGQEQDPLAGVFLIPLGMPWTILLDKLVGAHPAVALLAPAINAAILWLLARRFGKR